MDHPDYGRVRYTAVTLSEDPDEQVAQTIGYMVAMIREDAHHPAVESELLGATMQYPGMPVYEAIWHHVKSRMRFQRDEQTGGSVPTGIPGGVVVETLVRPRDMAMGNGVASQVGDCDDFSMLTAALLKCAGVPWKLVTIAVDSQYPEQFSHVYVAAYPNGGVRVPLDTSHGPFPGWEHPAPFRREEWGGGNGHGLMWAAAFVALALLTPGIGDEFLLLAKGAA